MLRPEQQQGSNTIFLQLVMLHTARVCLPAMVNAHYKIVSESQHCVAVPRETQTNVYSSQIGHHQQLREAIPPTSSLLNQWVYWGYRNIGKGLLTEARCLRGYITEKPTPAWVRGRERGIPGVA